MVSIKSAWGKRLKSFIKLMSKNSISGYSKKKHMQRRHWIVDVRYIYNRIEIINTSTWLYRDMKNIKNLLWILAHCTGAPTSKDIFWSRLRVWICEEKVRNLKFSILILNLYLWITKLPRSQRHGLTILAAEVMFHCRILLRQKL
jgi:hypothetical protein